MGGKEFEKDYADREMEEEKKGQFCDVSFFAGWLGVLRR